MGTKLPATRRKAIIFDMEGVVIDSEPLWSQSQKLFLKKLGKTFDDDDKRLIAGKSFIEGTRILKQRYNLRGELEELMGLRENAIKHLFKSKLVFIKGFREFHSSVSSRFLTCIATSCKDELLQITIEKLQLEQYFDHIFKVSDVGNRGKPQPDLFLYAARTLGVKPSECIVIEDSPHGIEATKRAGMYCIALTTTFPPEKLEGADMIVSSFSEIQLPTGR